MDSKEQKQPEAEKPVTHLKEKKSRGKRKKVLSETQTEVVMEVVQKPYRGEKLTNTIRKDHKFDPRQRFSAGRSL